MEISDSQYREINKIIYLLKSRDLESCHLGFELAESLDYLYSLYRFSEKTKKLVSYSGYLFLVTKLYENAPTRNAYIPLVLFLTDLVKNQNCFFTPVIFEDESKIPN